MPPGFICPILQQVGEIIIDTSGIAQLITAYPETLMSFISHIKV